MGSAWHPTFYPLAQLPYLLRFTGPPPRDLNSGPGGKFSSNFASFEIRIFSCVGILSMTYEEKKWVQNSQNWWRKIFPPTFSEIRSRVGSKILNNAQLTIGWRLGNMLSGVLNAGLYPHEMDTLNPCLSLTYFICLHVSRLVPTVNSILLPYFVTAEVHDTNFGWLKQVEV